MWNRWPNEAKRQITIRAIFHRTTTLFNNKRDIYFRPVNAEMRLFVLHFRGADKTRIRNCISKSVNWFWNWIRIRNGHRELRFSIFNSWFFSISSSFAISVISTLLFRNVCICANVRETEKSEKKSNWEKYEKRKCFVLNVLVCPHFGRSCICPSFLRE